MKRLEGIYTSARVYAKDLDSLTLEQIQKLINQPFMQGSKVCVMPDAHAGAGSTIGTTMTIDKAVVPYMVGVDIGCGMETTELLDTEVDLKNLDQVIHREIPSGFDIYDKPLREHGRVDLTKLRCGNYVDLKRAKASVGTLGGGNHFIEIAKNREGKLYLIIHSGSRNLGKQVADYYQEQAYRQRQRSGKNLKELISQMKKEGREKEIEKTLREIDTKPIERNTAWLEGETMEDYLHDMAIVQDYADLNRKVIRDRIIEKAGLKKGESFSTVHNYIHMESMILRKGAISAREGEKVLIPMNMRDGSLICIGKGNKDWNLSAPHGAGRLMSRTEAKRRISLEDFKDSMKGIYSTTVDRDTLDEAPMAYKPMEDILQAIGDTVEVVEYLKPIYNFKASEDNKPWKRKKSPKNR